MRNVLSSSEALAESSWRDLRSTSRVLEPKYRGSEAHYTPTAKEILATYEKVQATSEIAGTEAQLLLAPRLAVLRWMFKGQDLLLLWSNDSGHPSKALHPPLPPSSSAEFASKPTGRPQHRTALPICAEGLETAQQRRRQPCKAAAGAGMHRGPPGTRSSTRLFLSGIQNNKQEGAFGHCFSGKGGDGERARGAACQKAWLS